jgi:hypothetical protein
MARNLMQAAPVHMENGDTVADGFASSFAGEHTSATSSASWTRSGGYQTGRSSRRFACCSAVQARRAAVRRREPGGADVWEGGPQGRVHGRVGD